MGIIWSILMSEECEEFEVIENKPYVSFSQLNMCQRCPMQWFYRYVEGIKSPPGIALAKGSAYHKALETNFSQKIQSGVDLPIGDVKDAFVTEYSRIFSEEEVVIQEGESSHEAKDSGVAMVESYFRSGVTKTMQPVSVENKLTVPIPDTEYDLVAVVDLELTNGKVIDHKTASKKWFGNKALLDQQSTTYAIALNREPLNFEFHVMVNEKVPQLYIHPAHRDSEDIAWWLSNVKGLIKEMELLREGAFLPRPDGWWCDKRWCGYYDKCMPHRFRGR
jgi:hypothetical protein